MRVFAEAQALQNPVTVERGIGRYVGELAATVERNHPGAVSAWYLRPDLPVPPHIPELIRGARLRLQDDPDVRSPDIWHVTSPFESLTAPPEAVWPVWVRDPRTRLVTTLYDLIPLVYPDRYLSDPHVRQAYMSRLQLIEQSDRILAISEATARDATDLLGISPRRLDVVGTGVSEHFVPPVSREAALVEARSAVSQLRPDFVMYTGGIDFRKNIDGLLDAYAKLSPAMRSRHQLLIVCRVLPHERAQLEARAAELGIERDLLLTGYVPDEVLLALYQAAHLFIFPSLYEGFGLPVVEALSCGVPAIVGSNSSLTELIPDDRAQFDASDPESIANALRSVLGDDELRAALTPDSSDDRYRWSVVAERTLEAYEHAVAARPARDTRPRVAFITPMPPAPSGVADYSMALLGPMSERARIDVFAQPGADRPRLPGVRWFDYAELDAVEQIAGRHDARLVALGNSEHHIEPMRLLNEKGGTALAHDVRLTGLLGAAAQEAPAIVDPETIASLHAMYRGERPERHRDHRAVAPHAYYTVNGLLSGTAMRSADRILVHSDVAAMLVRSDLPASQRARVETVPFGHTLRAVPADGRQDTVASFGIVHAVKESETVCRAFVELSRRYPDLTFALVGEVVDPEMRETLRGVLDENPSARVVVTGRVSDDEYAAWLARSQLAVQLRAHSNGESSAAVADCLGSAVAVVTSNTGSLSTLRGIAELVEPGVAVDELVAVIDRLLSDPVRRAELAASGLAYARSHSFEAAANAILDATLGGRTPDDPGHGGARAKAPLPSCR